MAPTDYTDLIAAFTDPVAAETLAKFIASIGISCDVEEVSDYLAQAQPFQTRYGIRVPRAQRDNLKGALNLSLVAKYTDPISAEVAAGRLAREDIPCVVGWPRTFMYVWLQAVPTDESGSIGSRTLLVPRSFVGAAQRVLQQDMSGEALTNLALSEESDPNERP
ncbi:MAG TPA: hypothetical protein VNX02_11145 [Steroidobacteraceae bacterium]|jgi:hypothetical protein|nr:hypothetical protein [Steroidobacteraceae bacterium]